MGNLWANAGKIVCRKEIFWFVYGENPKKLSSENGDGMLHF